MAIAIVVMAKYPHGPAVKTRLGPSLGPAQRARLYEAFLADKLAQVRSVPEATCVLAFTPHEHRPWFERAAGGALLYPQVEGDLGARVTAAFDALCPRFSAGVILSDSDSPTLPTHRLEQAVDALRAGSELVLGPADDGGYYLIGLSRPVPGLFRGVEWSSPRTREQTLAGAYRLGLRCTLLAPWYDVDTPADLELLRRDLARAPTSALHTCAVFEQFGLLAASSATASRQR